MINESRNENSHQQCFQERICQSIIPNIWHITGLKKLQEYHNRKLSNNKSKQQLNQQLGLMVKHNNVIPNVHLRKHWQTNVKVWLNQAARKKRRLQARRAKAAAIAPRPLDNLRPVVNCQTIRYNHRLRLGRGFTLQQIKAVGLGVQFARSIGVSVDHRRKNRCQESLNKNKERLQKYINNLVLFPRSEKSSVSKAKTGILNDTPKENQKTVSASAINALPPLIKRVKPVSKALLDSYRKNSAYKTLRSEWTYQKNQGKRLKKQREAAQKK